MVQRFQRTLYNFIHLSCFPFQNVKVIILV